MIELDEVSVAYRVRGVSLRALEAASAVFPAGSLTALVGPSGCGKTSLVAAMAGLLPPESGRIAIDGEELRGVRPRTAVIFQDGGLLPWKTVRANAELPLVLRGVPRSERRRKVDPILEELGLLDFASFHPTRLSGGMRQRLGVARALACEPDLLLMDEPFSSLDALTREALQDGLLDVRQRHAVTMILVTHSIEEAAYLADRVYVFAGKAPGRIAGLVEWAGAGHGAAGQGIAPRGAAPRAPGFRTSDAYFARCAQLRSAFEAAVAACGAGGGPGRDGSAMAGSGA
jgi:NitT/TauT family transport system ATP-binding protein